MRTYRLVSLLCLASLPFVAAACTAPSPPTEEVGEATDDLVQFPSGAFAGAPLMTYGATTAPIPYTRGGWGVVRWAGVTGDDAVATVTATTADRTARAYLVEKRADGKYVALLSGTNAVDGVVSAKLEKTQEYFIVFREVSRRNATFTVKLDKTGSLPATCTGAPLVEQGIIDRTAQGEAPALNVTGVFEMNVRRCNVATGCTDPLQRKNPASLVWLVKRADGKWTLQGPLTADHDGTTGELKGNVNVGADDGRTIPVAVTGVATTGCISLSGRARNQIDALTYYDVDASYRASTPPVAPRTAYPATPPATECDGQATITDEELLARFPRASSSVALGQATIMEDQQYCHPQTGCRPWLRGAALINGGGRALRANALVLGRDSLGVQFVNPLNNVGSTFAVEDGTLNITADQLLRGGAAVNVGTISDTHLQVKEATVFASGEVKMRRYVCIPIPPHP